MGDETKSGTEDQAAQGDELEQGGSAPEETPEATPTDAPETDTGGGDNVEGDKVVNESPSEE